MLLLNARPAEGSISTEGDDSDTNHATKMVDRLADWLSRANEKASNRQDCSWIDVSVGNRLKK